MSFAFGVATALLLLFIPGWLIGRAFGLPTHSAAVTAPALTYGLVGLCIVTFGSIGIPWNSVSAGFALLGAIVVARLLWRWLRPKEHAEQFPSQSRAAVIAVALGIAIGSGLIFYAFVRGLTNWQSVPSTWDSMWHGNTIRYILDTGQASSTRMGDLRNVETHATLYYPSAFHGLAAVLSQLTGAAPTTSYTLYAVAGSLLFPLSAAALAWQMLRGRASRTFQAGCAATAAALSASFTALPYVEFYVAAVPNLVSFALGGPAVIAVTSVVADRSRIPVAVLAFVGIASVHTSGAIVAVVFVAAWWLLAPLSRYRGKERKPRRRVGNGFLPLAIAGVVSLVLLYPQLRTLLQLSEIIAGHQFTTPWGKKRALLDALTQHTRHLADYPVQSALLWLALLGAVVLIVKRVYWPLAVWLLLIVAIVHSSTPFGGFIGRAVALFSDAFYSDPRRLSAIVCLLLAPAAGIGLFTLAYPVLTRLRGERTRQWALVATAITLAAVCAFSARHYFLPHKYLVGAKYDQVMVGPKKLDAFAYLATLPGAKDTTIGDGNVDGSGWMYAVAGLHPLWTHYDFPQQQGPGYHRYIFWAYADDADTDRRVTDAVHALNIRYVMTSTPVVQGFKVPDGLRSLDRSRSWRKLYDSGAAQIYEWVGDQKTQAEGDR
ncbi:MULTISPECIES: DUF6541 family protein [Mycobacteroides]|uniref:Transmembrane protein alanine and leucine rich n=1 Tax=Mycobacteroides chelonae TaxID=1774 RepID=A0A1S1LI40_MYCCH|nr:MULTISPECIES: DUF6541 family protein [Mycobacteroides]KRQ20206.1 hypothetical protein AOT87_18695 [Mycobacteroides sp. H003]KRQ31043.1 hypothetical protein AOT91_13900 [Mycobacteroides sp. H092]KRQ43109.1 hypothetical protein AOT92_09085 [Mycobacteroides sp. H101]KRQ52789.1 hypothetical protein AOT88_02755 [Mycobacteroides sp. H063]KRQ59474.1 hypothetical protein AOT94_09680 [Mycobacteroides sp. HXVII]